MSAAKPNLADHKYAGYAFNSLNMKARRNLGIALAERAAQEEALSGPIHSAQYLNYLVDLVAETLLRKGPVRPLAPADTGSSAPLAAFTRKKPEPVRKTLGFLNCLNTVHQ